MPISHSVGPSLGGSKISSPTSISQPEMNFNTNVRKITYPIDASICEFQIENLGKKVGPGVMVNGVSYL